MVRDGGPWEGALSEGIRSITYRIWKNVWIAHLGFDSCSRSLFPFFLFVDTTLGLHIVTSQAWCHS